MKNIPVNIPIAPDSTYLLKRSTDTVSDLIISLMIEMVATFFQKIIIQRLLIILTKNFASPHCRLNFII